MQTRHSNPEQYFREQYITSKRYILPFVESRMRIGAESLVAEIGCGFGGNMLPFVEAGCSVYGIDIDARAIAGAKDLFAGLPEERRPRLMTSDICSLDPAGLPRFDLIIMRDVLEHIRDRQELFRQLESILKPDGIVFIGFPPFSMPFGGHQQMCTGVASRLPYIHLLPRSLYAGLLRLLGESGEKIDGLLEIKDCGVHLRDFYAAVGRSGFAVAEEVRYLVNPNYEVKFGMKPRRLLPLLNIPQLREFFTTTVYVLLSKREDPCR